MKGKKGGGIQRLAFGKDQGRQFSQKADRRAKASPKGALIGAAKVPKSERDLPESAQVTRTTPRKLLNEREVWSVRRSEQSDHLCTTYLKVTAESFPTVNLSTPKRLPRARVKKPEVRKRSHG